MYKYTCGGKAFISSMPIKFKREPAIVAMHGPYCQFSVLTNRVDPPYSHTAEVVTKDTGVIRGSMF